MENTTLTKIAAMDRENSLNKKTKQIGADLTIHSELNRLAAITEYLRLKRSEANENVYLCYQQFEKKFWVSLNYSEEYLRANKNLIIVDLK